MRISDWSSDVCSSDLPGFGPWQVALGRRVRKHEPAHRIGAEAFDDVVGIDNVLLRLRHLDDTADVDRQAIFPERCAVGTSFDFVRAEKNVAAILAARIDRKSVVSGKSVSVRVDLGGRRTIK